MAITVVGAQSNENSGSSATTIATAAASHTAGNLLFASVSFNVSGASPTVTVTNTAGDTFTQIDSVIDGFTLIETRSFYAKNIAGNGSDVVTATLSAARTTPGITVVEVSGLDTTAPLDAHTTGSVDAGNPVTSGSFSTAQADEIILAGGGAYSELNPQAWTAGTGYTIPASGASAYGASVAQYKIVAATQSGVTASLSWSGNNYMNIVVATFKAAAAGGVTVAPQLMLMGCGM